MTFRIMEFLKRAGFRLPKDGQPLHEHDVNARRRLAEVAVSRKPHKFPAQPEAAKPAEGHACRRFKTACKRAGVRLTVACRECGARRMASPMHDISGPVAALP